jgi:hypothetical protein
MRTYNNNLLFSALRIETKWIYYYTIWLFALLQFEHVINYSVSKILINNFMRYKLLGKSGLKVSGLSLGTMTFGEDRGWGSSKEESRKIFDAFVNSNNQRKICKDLRTLVKFN